MDLCNDDDGIQVLDNIRENILPRAVKIIQSYAGVVDKMVWKKE